MIIDDDWNKRAQKFGHTGHSEPFYYCFDQQARLFAIDEIIKKLKLTKNKTLDFGCGSGDFLNLLNTHFETVHGYDSSDIVINLNKHKHLSSAIFTTSNLQQLEMDYDLILTVTVLQCCNSTHLNQTLSFLSTLLNEDGLLLCLESFIPLQLVQTLNSTKATETDWHEALKKNNLELVSIYNFYNPVIHPSKSWIIYTKNPFLKVLRLFKKLTYIQNYFSYRSKKIILKYKDVLIDEKTEFPIYVIKKIKN